MGRGANIDCRDNKGMTPLQRAVEKINGKIVLMLLERGANRKIKNCRGQTALSMTSVDEI